jgi:hypothetical protein
MPQSVSLMKELPKTDRAKVSKNHLLAYWKERVRRPDTAAAEKAD